MKIVINDSPRHFLDLDAPTLPAVEVFLNNPTLWRIYCRYRRGFHYHGPGDGHREAHCPAPTPHGRTGYNLAPADDSE